MQYSKNSAQKQTAENQQAFSGSNATRSMPAVSVLQKVAPEEELQMKSAVVQKAEPEEELPLQGKFVAQRQAPEDELPI
ncbi:MAG: hypothetical protein Q8928_10685 [Bacteroidota bacterium]|nr:hypothetical protein [Bacteroidota bacterium]